MAAAVSTRAKLYDFVAQVTNWKPKGVGICRLTLSCDEGEGQGEKVTLAGCDERGEEVLRLLLLPSMSYARPASTFHSIETGKNVGVALYFGSASDEWFDPGSAAFAERVEAELARLREKTASVFSSAPAVFSASSSSLAAPAVPVRRPAAPAAPAPVPRRGPGGKELTRELTKSANELTKSSSELTVEVAVAHETAVAEAVAPAASLRQPISESAELRESAEVTVEELIAGPAATSASPAPEVSEVSAVPELPELPGGEKKSEESELVDYTALEVLPPLPSEIPPNVGGKEHKNYHRLRMEHLRRNPDAVLPGAPSGASSGASGASGASGTPGRRNTAAGRAKSPPAKRAAPAARRPASPREEANGLPPAAIVLPPAANVSPAVVVAPTVVAAVAPVIVSSPAVSANVSSPPTNGLPIASPPPPAVVPPRPSPQPAAVSGNVSQPAANGLPEGWAAQLQGVAEYPDGSRYVGELLAGVKHGKGLVVYCDGSTFEGAWAGGRRSGLGTRTSAFSREVFRGRYLADLKCGPGLLAAEDGSEYLGWHADNERHGCGSFRWPRGDVEDREYARGALVARKKTSDSVWPPPHLAGLVAPVHGVPVRLEWTPAQNFFPPASSRLVCVAGSWDDWAHLTPLGCDGGLHAVVLLLERGKKVWFRFVAQGREWLAPHGPWAVEEARGAPAHCLVPE